MENDSKKINCPICKSRDNKFCFCKNTFNFYRCLVCDHLFIPLFSFDAVSFYGKDYFVGAENGSGYVNYDNDKMPMTNVFIEYLKKIEKILGRKGRLLDVGAATGFFIGVAKQSGWEGQGLEISKYATEIAKGKGLTVDCGTFDNLFFEPESFDCVTMWDVLEHLPKPGVDIKKIYLLLKNDGVVAINTPDSGSLFARVMGKRWHLLVPPEHLNYFTNKSLKILLESSGFRIEMSSRVGKTFTLEYIFSILAFWLKIKILSKVVNFLKTHPKIGDISIPINLHDNMFIIAKKIKK